MSLDTRPLLSDRQVAFLGGDKKLITRRFAGFIFMVKKQRDKTVLLSLSRLLVQVVNGENNRVTVTTLNSMESEQWIGSDQSGPWIIEVSQQPVKPQGQKRSLIRGSQCHVSYLCPTPKKCLGRTEGWHDVVGVLTRH